MSPTPIDGILNIDKPYGLTSMDVVRRLKRASSVKRVGHGGTLDPVATGVIAICFGQATRVMEYLVEGTKEYRAVIELGVTTDTYDALGQVTERQDSSHVSGSDIELALKSFQGCIQQIPPMYSAIKMKGKRLYDLARAGIEVERKPRQVEVFAIEMLEWSPPLVTVRVSCGRGFYMRSLAFDLGEVLGCGGHLKNLNRFKSGPFRVSDALSLAEAEEHFDNGTLADVLYGPDAVLGGLRAVIAGRRLEDMIANGRSIPAGFRLPMSRPDERCRVYATDGRFLAILKAHTSSKHWRPDKVFAISYSPEHSGLSPLEGH